jgi:hypothetical protein
MAYKDISQVMRLLKEGSKNPQEVMAYIYWAREVCDRTDLTFCQKAWLTAEKLGQMYPEFATLLPQIQSIIDKQGADLERYGRLHVRGHSNTFIFYPNWTPPRSVWSLRKGHRRRNNPYTYRNSQTVKIIYQTVRHGPWEFDAYADSVENIGAHISAMMIAADGVKPHRVSLKPERVVSIE